MKGGRKQEGGNEGKRGGRKGRKEHNIMNIIPFCYNTDSKLLSWSFFFLLYFISATVNSENVLPPFATQSNLSQGDFSFVYLLFLYIFSFTWLCKDSPKL